MGLRDPTTGEELSLHEALHEIEHDLLHRSDKAEAGSPTLHAQVRQEVVQIRAAALKHTDNEASEFASWTMVKECCSGRKRQLGCLGHICGFKRIKGFWLFGLW